MAETWSEQDLVRVQLDAIKIIQLYADHVRPARNMKSIGDFDQMVAALAEDAVRKS